MVRRQTLSKRDDDAFEATGKVGDQTVTVRQMFEVHDERGVATWQATPPRSPIDGGYQVAETVEFTPGGLSNTGGKTRVPITGYLLPGQFIAEGLDYSLSFRVGHVADGKKLRWGITHLRIEAGRREDGALFRPASRSVFPAKWVSETLLLNLAYSASRVHGFAYAPGVVFDPATGAVTGQVKVGDPDPFPDLLFSPNIGEVKNGVVTELPDVPLTVLRSRVAERAPAGEARYLIGHERPGPPGDGCSDEHLRLIADLYRKAYADPTARPVPEWVRQQFGELTQIWNGESWIRQRAVEARRRGFLTEGKRNRKPTTGKRKTKPKGGRK